MTSKTIAAAMASITEPLEYFLQHGIFDPSLGMQRIDRVSYSTPKGEISDYNYRRIARTLAAEQRRPFIVAQPRFSSWTWEQGKSPRGVYIRKFHEPKWEQGYMEIPKRNYMRGHIHPFLLMGEDPKRFSLSNKLETIWRVHVFDRELWNTVYELVRDDPDLRRARRVPK